MARGGDGVSLLEAGTSQGDSASPLRQTGSAHSWNRYTHGPLLFRNKMIAALELLATLVNGDAKETSRVAIRGYADSQSSET